MHLASIFEQKSFRFNFNVMKKLLLLFFVFFSLIGFTGCQKKCAKEIIGHTYGKSSSTERVSFYFSPSGTVTYSYYGETGIVNSPHFLYNIVGDDVEVFYDSSSFWLPEVQGTLFIHLTYDPEEDVLRYLSDVLCRLD